MKVLRYLFGSMIFFLITYLVGFKLVPFLWSHGSSAGVDLAIVCIFISVVSGFLGLFFFGDFVDALKLQVARLLPSKDSSND